MYFQVLVFGFKNKHRWEKYTNYTQKVHKTKQSLRAGEEMSFSNGAWFKKVGMHVCHLLLEVGMRVLNNFVALDKLSTLCSNSLQFHYILLQFSIKFEQECNNNFIIALLLGLQCNNNLLLHSCSNFIQNQCLINETNTTLPTVPTLKIFWLSIKSCIARFYLSKSETIFE